MAIGFVSAGFMNLPQAISIIIGANIGTTMTAQIIAFKLSDYIYAIIFVGFIISFLVESEKVKNIGQTIFAFGLLFLGIETMGSVMKPLADSPVFTAVSYTHLGLIGSVPTTTYGENIGVMAVTKVYSVRVIGGAAVLTIICSFVGKLAMLIQTCLLYTSRCV